VEACTNSSQVKVSITKLVIVVVMVPVKMTVGVVVHPRIEEQTEAWDRGCFDAMNAAQFDMLGTAVHVDGAASANGTARRRAMLIAGANFGFFIVQVATTQ
jgi:hypothetical protein